MVSPAAGFMIESSNMIMPEPKTKRSRKCSHEHGKLRKKNSNYYTVKKTSYYGGKSPARKARRRCTGFSHDTPPAGLDTPLKAARRVSLNAAPNTTSSSWKLDSPRRENGCLPNGELRPKATHSGGDLNGNELKVPRRGIDWNGQLEASRRGCASSLKDELKTAHSGYSLKNSSRCVTTIGLDGELKTPRRGRGLEGDTNPPRRATSISNDHFITPRRDGGSLNVELKTSRRGSLSAGELNRPRHVSSDQKAEEAEKGHTGAPAQSICSHDGIHSNPSPNPNEASSTSIENASNTMAVLIPPVPLPNIKVICPAISLCSSSLMPQTQLREQIENDGRLSAAIQPDTPSSMGNTESVPICNTSSDTSTAAVTLPEPCVAGGFCKCAGHSMLTDTREDLRCAVCKGIAHKERLHEAPAGFFGTTIMPQVCAKCVSNAKPVSRQDQQLTQLSTTGVDRDFTTKDLKDEFLQANPPTDDTNLIAAPAVGKQSKAQDVDFLVAAAVAVSAEMLRQSGRAVPAVRKVEVESTVDQISHFAGSCLPQHHKLCKESAKLFVKRELVAVVDSLYNTSNKEPKLLEMPRSDELITASSRTLQLDDDEESLPDELSI